MIVRKIRTIYYLLTGAFWFSTALLVPLYILYLMERGLNLGQIGLWAGANTAAVILLEIPTGGLADSWGRGRTYSTANLIIACSLLLMVLIPGTAVLYIGAAIFGAGRALSSGSLDAWFIDALIAENPKTDIEKELGPAGGIQLLALALGSVLGAMLPTLVSVPFLQSYPALAIPLLADASIKVLIAILTGILVKEPLRHDSAFQALKESVAAVPKIFKSVRLHLGRENLLIALFVAGTSISFVSGSLETLWQPHFSDLSGYTSGVRFGFVLAGGFLSGALCSFLAPGVTSLLGGRRYLTAMLFSILTTVAMILLSRAGTSLGMALAMSMVFFASEGIGVPRRALLNDLVPGDMRATILSVDSLVSYIGFAGIVGIGFLAESRGIPFTWRIVAFVAFPASLLYLLFRRR